MDSQEKGKSVTGAIKGRSRRGKVEGSSVGRKVTEMMGVGMPSTLRSCEVTSNTSERAYGMIFFASIRESK